MIDDNSNGKIVQPSAMSAVESFQMEMESKGLGCSCRLIADGSIHRFHVDGDQPNSKNGWYLFHDDESPVLIFGSWKSGESFAWSHKNGKPLTAENQKRHQDRIGQAKMKSERLRMDRATQAAIEAQRIWDSSQPASQDHEYLKRKQIQPNGVREVDGKLVVPLHDDLGEIRSLQFIQGDGKKRFLPGGEIKGNYFSIGEQTDRIYISEGFATAATVNEATDCMVVVAFDCGNLKAVAQAIRHLYPHSEIVIACDDDSLTPGNPGITKGKAAADAINATVVFPLFKQLKSGSDFNDLAVVEGLEVVRAQLQPEATETAQELTPRRPDAYACASRHDQATTDNMDI